MRQCSTDIASADERNLFTGHYINLPRGRPQTGKKSFARLSRIRKEFNNGKARFKDYLCTSFSISLESDYPFLPYGAVHGMPSLSSSSHVPHESVCLVASPLTRPISRRAGLTHRTVVAAKGSRVGKT